MIHAHVHRRVELSVTVASVRTSRELSDSQRQTRSVRSVSSKHWQPPEGLSPEEVRAGIAAASCERDQLLLRVLWATGARISEVLALRPMDVQRDSLILPNRKNPNVTIKRVFLPGAELGLTGPELLIWAKEQGLAHDEPLFFSRKGGVDGSSRAIQRGQAWLIVKQLRSEPRCASWHFVPPDTARPVNRRPCILICSVMHACARSCASTRNLPLAQRQAGWSRLQMAYLTIGDDEARQLMRHVTD
jgi:integrase